MTDMDTARPIAEVNIAEDSETGEWQATLSVMNIVVWDERGGADADGAIPAMRDTAKSINERVAQSLRRIIRNSITRVCELPDRTSPEDWPAAMIVTDEELHHILQEELLEHFEAKP